MEIFNFSTLSQCGKSLYQPELQTKPHEKSHIWLWITCESL